MNYLAHAYLAGPLAGDRLGGLMGDFVKGPLPGVLPGAIAAGVALHRNIDSYADAHPAFRRSRARVGEVRRRFAGIMVDMFYDHLLAAQWQSYGDCSLPDFTRQIYALLRAHESVLPERLQGILPYMEGDDWLAGYASLDATGVALDRIARHRLRAPNTLAGAIEELRSDYAGFAADFAEFIIDCRDYAADRRRVLAIEFGA